MPACLIFPYICNKFIIENMRFKLLSLLMSVLLFLPVAAQQVSVSPVPHDVSWGDPAFPITGNWDCVLIDKKERVLNIKRYDVDGSDRRIEL